MSRCSDNELRETITVIERMLLTNPSTDAVLIKCLNQLMSLFEANFGYVYRCRDSRTDDDIVSWELTGCCKVESNKLIDFESTSTSDHIPEQLQARFLAGRMVHFEGDNAPWPRPHLHPPISDALCIPICDDRRIYGVLYLCNSPSGFDPDIEARIRPFIAAAGCLLRSVEKKFQFQTQARPQQTAIENSDMLLGLIDSLFNGVLIVNDDDIITLCNTAAASMLNLPKRDIIGAQLSRFLPKGAPKLQGRLSSDYEPRENRSTQKTVWRGVPAFTDDGQKILIDLSAFDLNMSGEPLRGLVMDDISERMKSAADSHETLQRFQLLTNIVPVGILQLNRVMSPTSYQAAPPHNNSV